MHVYSKWQTHYSSVHHNFNAFSDHPVFTFPLLFVTFKSNSAKKYYYLKIVKICYFYVKKYGDDIIIL
jgi:hypothetical protein